MADKMLQFVSLEQAQKLKELGFDWKTDRCGCIIENKLRFDCDNCKYRIDGCTRISLKWRIGVPSVALALKWFRDEQGVVCFVEPHGFVGAYLTFRCSYILHSNLGIKEYIRDENINFYNTYEKAESALLDRLIELELKKEVSDGG